MKNKIKTISMIFVLSLTAAFTAGCDQAEELKKSTFDLMDQTMDKAKEQIDQVKEKVEQFNNPKTEENISSEELPGNQPPAAEPKTEENLENSEDSEE